MVAISFNFNWKQYCHFSFVSYDSFAWGFKMSQIAKMAVYQAEALIEVLNKDLK